MTNALGIKFNATSSGTGDFVDASVVSGYRRGASNLVDGATYRYRAENAALTEWEWGTGVWNATTSTLARTTMEFTSTGSKVSFTAAPQVSVVIFPRDIREVLQANRTYAVSKTGSDSNTGLPLATTGTVTFVNASSNIGWTAHGRSVGDNFMLATSGALPTNFDNATLYYVKTVVDASNIIASLTSGGAAITAGSAGSGTHTATVYSPFLTIQRALGIVQSLDFNASDLSIQVGGGTYVENITLVPYIGRGTQGHTTPAITGSLSSPTSVVIAPASGNAISGTETGSYEWVIKNLQISSTLGTGINTDVGSWISVSNVNFGTNVNHVICSGGTFEFVGSCTFSGSASSCAIQASNRALILDTGNAHTISGTPAWGFAFIYLTNQSLAYFAGGSSFTGASTGTRWNFDESSFCTAPSAFNSFFPGNANGAYTPIPIIRGGTGDTGSAWSAYTPTVAPSSGAITTSSATGRYKTIGKTVFFVASATITTNGTGSGTLQIGLPATAGAGTYLVVGNESAVNGKEVAGQIPGGNAYANCRFYDGTYPGANGFQINIGGVFESA